MHAVAGNACGADEFGPLDQSAKHHLLLEYQQLSLTPLRTIATSQRIARMLRCRTTSLSIFLHREPGEPRRMQRPPRQHLRCRARPVLPTAATGSRHNKTAMPCAQKKTTDEIFAAWAPMRVAAKQRLESALPNGGKPGEGGSAAHGGKPATAPLPRAPNDALRSEHGCRLYRPTRPLDLGRRRIDLHRRLNDSDQQGSEYRKQNRSSNARGHERLSPDAPTWRHTTTTSPN